MRRSSVPAWLARAYLFAAALTCSDARAQSYAELVEQHRALTARLRAMEAAGLAGTQPPHGRESAHAHDSDGHRDSRSGYRDETHDEPKEHGGHERGDEQWTWEDPFTPGWWRPSDEYRPYSWMPPPNEGFLRDLLRGQFVETHRSSSGTPWVHPFTIEPPQLHRDLFMFYKYTKDAEGTNIDEHELEVHLDWALTRRFGILVAAPFLGRIGPAEQATGFGDIEFAPRVVLAESERFFLATNIFITAPTGDDSRDLGAGETTIAPLLTSWHDLGSLDRIPWTHWNTAYLNVGPESGVRSGETTLVYTAVVAHSFVGPKLIFPHHHGNGHGPGNESHGEEAHEQRGGTISPLGPGYPPGLTSVIVELNGQSELFGERQTYLQFLTGVNYILTDSAEVRFGINFPLNRLDEQMDAQYILGFSYIF